MTLRIQARALALGIAIVAAFGALAAAAGAHDGAPAFNQFQAAATATVGQSKNVEYVTGRQGFTGGHVMIEGNRLYVGSYGLGMNIYDISDPADPVRIGGYLPGERADAVPDAAVFDGRHIAVLNGTSRVSGPVQQIRTDRAEFLDVTDPANPVKLAEFVGPDDGEAHNGDIVDVRRWWLPSGGRGVNGLRIYDLNPILSTVPAAPANLFRGNPVTLWENSPYRGSDPIGAPFTHTHDITVYPNYGGTGRDIALLAEGGNYVGSGNTGSVFVIDISNPATPVVLERFDTDNRRPGSHPIRYFHEAQFLDGDPTLMLVTDEDLHNGCGSAGGVAAVRLSADLTTTTELSEWFVPFGTTAAICSAHVFSSAGDLVFMGSYNAGLQVIDYSDPSRPVQAGYFIAEGSTAWGAQIQGDYVYVGDMSRGLDVMRWTPPAPPPTPMADLSLTQSDISFSKQKITGGDYVTITATVHNLGDAAASGVRVRFEDNGTQIADEQTIASIPAGATGQASVVWSTKHLKGDHVITVSADPPPSTVSESDETNNSASTVVNVRGNKAKNGSFESSSSGSAPDDWSSSGNASYAQGGSDGERSVTAGPGGSWTSAPIDVAAGTSYGVSVATTGVGATLVVEQLSASGVVIASSVLALPTTFGVFDTVVGALTAVDGASRVRISLDGGLLGATTFDDVRLWQD